MSFFWLLVVAGFLFALWRKVEDLQRRLWELSGELQMLHERLRDDVAAPASEASARARPSPAQRIVEPETGQSPGSSTTEALPAEANTAPAPLPEPPAPERETSAIAREGVVESITGDLFRSHLSFDFEDIFGRRLPIWGGGIALAIAGIFLVRYSIEQGLVTPLVRVVFSFLFGLALLGGAEAAYRFEQRIRDERVRQALAGAGLATLFGAFYLAGTQYGLIGAGSAFVGLAAVTTASIALSFRFGLPSAILGLVGGFAAPMLVSSTDPNVPLLALYLALVTGGLTYAGRAQQRQWLSYAALAGGLLWGFLLMLGGLGETGDIFAIGTYLVVIGTVLPAFLRADKGPSIPRLLAGGVATIQMAGLVADAGYGLLTWGLYLLLGAALAFFGWRDVRLRIGCGIAAGIGVALTAMWIEPAAKDFGLVAAGIAAIFAAIPLAQLQRGDARLAELAQLALVPLALGAVAWWQFGNWDDQRETTLALAMGGLALLPAAGAWLEWRTAARRDFDLGLAGLLASAALLAWWALLAVSEGWSAPLCTAAVALMLCEVARWRGSTALTCLAWAGAGLAVLALLGTGDIYEEIGQLAGDSAKLDLTRTLPRWLAAAIPFLALAWSGKSAAARWAAEAVAALLIYGFAAQLLPGDLLAWSAAIAAVALAWSAPGRLGGCTMWIGIAALWAVEPLTGWYLAGTLSLVGEPLLVTDVTPLNHVLLRLAPFMLAAAALGWRLGNRWQQLRVAAYLASALVGMVAIHSLWKLVFRIDEVARFELLGLGERSLWEALLLVSAYALMRYRHHRELRIAGCSLLAAALLHFGWYTLVLHNPLWSLQHAGPAPVANWLLAAYGAAGAALAIGRRELDERLHKLQPAIDVLLMALISLFALSSLRHAFAGSLMAGVPLGPTEDLLRSVLAILLAIGFLLWGARQQNRSWRIGSLVLMLLAVFKVFIVDTAGLEGLLRIASYMALGFSLIGIGWFYSRQLSNRTSPDD